MIFSRKKISSLFVLYHAWNDHDDKKPRIYRPYWESQLRFTFIDNFCNFSLLSLFLTLSLLSFDLFLSLTLSIFHRNSAVSINIIQVFPIEICLALRLLAKYFHSIERTENALEWCKWEGNMNHCTPLDYISTVTVFFFLHLSCVTFTRQKSYAFFSFSMKWVCANFKGLKGV